MAETCRVTGILRDLHGEALVGVTVTVSLNYIRSTSDGAVMPRQKQVVTNNSGEFDAEFIPGSYDMFWQANGITYNVFLNVPDAEYEALENCIAAFPSVVYTAGPPGPAGPQGVPGPQGPEAASTAEAKEAADIAVAAADRAEQAVDAAQTYASASATAAVFYDTIALGRAAVANGATFGVVAGGSDGLTHATIYRRNSSTTQTKIVEIASGAALDLKPNLAATKCGIILPRAGAVRHAELPVLSISDITNPASGTPKLTFKQDTIFTGANYSYTLASDTTIDFLTSTTAQRLYLDKSSNTFVVKAFNATLSASELSTYILVATVRVRTTSHGSQGNQRAAMDIGCPYVFDGEINGFSRSHWGYGQWAAVMPPRGSKLPNIDNDTRKFTLFNDTILRWREHSYALTSDITVDLMSTTTGSWVYWDVRDNSIPVVRWDTTPSFADMPYLVLVAFVRAGGGGGAAMSCPYTVNGRAPFALTPGMVLMPTSLPQGIRGIAHRGMSGTAPENTIPAYQLAHTNGFKVAEVDVQMTADGVPVCLHDTTINRTSNGTGNIADLTLAEVKEFDFGSWKSSAYAGTKIPTLAELLKYTIAVGMHLYIEIKDGASASDCEKIVQVVKRAGADQTVSYISFSIDTLINVAKIDNMARLGYVFNSIGSGTITNLQMLRQYTYGEVFADIGQAYVGTDTYLQNLFDAGFRVEAWTVNSSSTAQTLIRRGVTGIATDTLDIAAIAASYAAGIVAS